MNNKKFEIKYDEKMESYIIIDMSENEPVAIFGNYELAETLAKLLNKEWIIVKTSREEFEEELSNANRLKQPPASKLLN